MKLPSRRIVRAPPPDCFESRERDEGWYDAPTTLKILASPKPPSPALYFGNHGYLEKRRLDLGEHEPQGRKVYLHHREAEVENRCYETGEPNEQRKLKMRVQPLKTGTPFLFHLDFTNLTAEEVGWLLYAVRPAPKFRHKLGMGKPLGLGRAEIAPLALAFVDRLAIYAHDGLFGPRYGSVEVLGDPPEWKSSPAFLGRRYRAERKALEAGASRQEPFPSADELRETVRDTIPGEVRWPLELLGDPEQVSAEVTYPVLLGQATEGEHFRWFVENDRRHRKPLSAISPGSTLPLLERYQPAPKKSGNERRGR